MHAQNQARLRSDRIGVILNVCVRLSGAHLNQPRPGLAQDVRNAKAAADLDQLTPAETIWPLRLQPASWRAAAKSRSRAVVDDETRRLSRIASGDLDQKFFCARSSVTSLASDSRSNSRLQYPSRHRGKCSESRLRSEARGPRFVCRITPVALITGCKARCARTAESGSHSLKPQSLHFQCEHRPGHRPARDFAAQLRRLPRLHRVQHNGTRMPAQEFQPRGCPDRNSPT